MRYGIIGIAVVIVAALMQVVEQRRAGAIERRAERTAIIVQRAGQALAGGVTIPGDAIVNRFKHVDDHAAYPLFHQLQGAQARIAERGLAVALALHLRK